MVASLTGHQLTEVEPDSALISKIAPATLPVLETPEGRLISQTSAICEYLAQKHENLLGSTDFERAQVDQWMSFVREETWPLTKTLAAFTFGSLQCTATEHAFIYN